MLNYKAGNFIFNHAQLQCTHLYHRIRHLWTIFIFLSNSDHINIFHLTDFSGCYQSSVSCGRGQQKGCRR